MINNIVIGGRLVKDPELSTSSNGKEYSRFNIVRTDGYGDNATTTFLDVICFGADAKFISGYKKKGDYVVAIGELSVTKKDDKTYVQIKASKVDSPPITHVDAAQVKRPYDQTVNVEVPNVDELSHQIGMDGTLNQKQVDAAKKQFQEINDKNEEEMKKIIDSLPF